MKCSKTGCGSGRSTREPVLTDLEAVAREASRCERWAAEIDAEHKIGSEWARGFSAAMGDIVKLCEQMGNSSAISNLPGHEDFTAWYACRGCGAETRYKSTSGEPMCGGC